MAEKSLDIILRGKYQGKQAFGDAKKDVESLREQFAKTKTQLLALVGGAATMAAGMKVLAGAVQVYRANREEAAALDRQSASDMLTAQREQVRGWAEIGGALPGIGEGIRKLVEQTNDVRGLEQRIAKMRELESATAAAATAAAALHAETEGRVATRAGEPDMTAESLNQRAAARQAQLDKLMDIERRHKTELAAAEKRTFTEQTTFHLTSGSFKRATREEGLLREQYEKAVAARREYAAEMAAADAEDNRDYEAAREAARATEAAATTKHLAQVKAWTRSELELKLDGIAETAEAARESARTIAATKREEAALIAQIDARAAALRQQARDDEVRAAEATEKAKTAAIRRETETRQRERESAQAKQQAEWQANFDESVKLAHDRQGMEDAIFNTTHTAREQAIRDINREADAMRTKYAEDAEMLGLIEQTRQARMNALGPDISPMRNTEVRAMQSRFMTQAPGRDDPRWAQQLLEQSRKQTDALERQANREGVVIVKGSMS